MIHDKMEAELQGKGHLELAKEFAYEYLNQVEQMDAFPQLEALNGLIHFEEELPVESTPAEAILETLHQYGSPATNGQVAGRYFGFVNGGIVPAALGVKWLSDAWDQNGGLFFTSPINSKLEQVCEQWLKSLFGLPDETVAGFVSGTSMANLSALCAARYQLLKNQGWDINQDGLVGAPPIRILAHQQVHSSIKKTLAMLGFGYNNIEWLPSDDQGRLIVSALPTLDNSCLILLQAGNVNTGAFDPFDAVCELAENTGAWIHIDGAFGLWAAATTKLKALTKGMERADSWAVDGHKTLNTPYDCGIVLCRHEDVLISALQATGSYLVYSENRDPILYGPEMSKRARAIELWATLKSLGRSGVDEMVTQFHELAKAIAQKLTEHNFEIINEVAFNQVLVRMPKEQATKALLANIQKSGTIWLGGSTWEDKPAIRISICSWKTTMADIEQAVATFVAARTALKESINSLP
ncbi:MAG: aminotransferase class V-fold PLP-dependent enzyme [Bacteroidota bacterium]